MTCRGFKFRKLRIKLLIMTSSKPHENGSFMPWVRAFMIYFCQFRELKVFSTCSTPNKDLFSPYGYYDKLIMLYT